MNQFDEVWIGKRCKTCKGINIINGKKVLRK